MAKIKKKYLKDIDFHKKYDFENKKSIHIRVSPSKREDVKAKIYEKFGIKISEAFETLSHSIINEDPNIIAILNEYRFEKEKRDYLEHIKNQPDDKKIMHLRLLSKTKNELCVQLYRLGLSVSETFQYFMDLILSNNRHVIAIIEDYAIKKDNEENLITDTDADAIFEEINRLRAVK